MEGKFRQKIYFLKAYGKIESELYVWQNLIFSLDFLKEILLIPQNKVVVDWEKSRFLYLLLWLLKYQKKIPQKKQLFIYKNNSKTIQKIIKKYRL